MVRYVRAVKGEASTVKGHLPFVCPDVEYIERMIGSSEAIVIVAKDKDVMVGAAGGWLTGTPSGYDIEDGVLRQHGAYDEAHLYWIAVKEEYGEKGIGSTLIERVCISSPKVEDKDSVRDKVASIVRDHAIKLPNEQYVIIYMMYQPYVKEEERFNILGYHYDTMGNEVLLGEKKVAWAYFLPTK